MPWIHKHNYDNFLKNGRIAIKITKFRNTALQKCWTKPSRKITQNANITGKQSFIATKMKYTKNYTNPFRNFWKQNLWPRNTALHRNTALQKCWTKPSRKITQNANITGKQSFIATKMKYTKNYTNPFRNFWKQNLWPRNTALHIHVQRYIFFNISKIFNACNSFGPNLTRKNQKNMKHAHLKSPPPLHEGPNITVSAAIKSRTQLDH